MTKPEPTKATPERMFTYRDVGEVLQLGETVVKGLVRDGHLTAVKVGGSVRIRASDLQTYIDNLPPHSPARTSASSAA